MFLVENPLQESALSFPILECIHIIAFAFPEDLTIGVCDRCGNRYYSADILRTVDEVASGRRPPKRTEPVPVAHLRSA